MLLRYFYDEKLAHASYLVGCQKTGEAIVVDPMRNITPYLETAKKEGLHIVGALETHIHADFVAGSRELAAETSATMYISDEGDENWKYENLDGITAQLLKDGDSFPIGNLKFEVMHTPGHTPESISFLLTDQGGGADKPMGIFTGDFVFVGDVGRPDLLEKAAGIVGTSESGAKAMYQSIEKFKQLPDYLQVWPAHGAGSACGKSLGAVPSSTVGYEKEFNWAMRFSDEASFMKALLEGQPEPPRYFAVMKRVNKVGVPLVHELPAVKKMEGDIIANYVSNGHLVVDTRPSDSFKVQHLEKTVNVPFDASFTNWMGWIVDYDTPFYLIAEDEEIEAIKIALRSIGIDNLAGYAIPEDVKFNDVYEEIEPKDVREYLQQGAHLIDVRNLTEWEAGHIEDAQHIMLGSLNRRIEEIPQAEQVIVQCQSGARSAIGTSILRRHGINAINMIGGYNRYESEVVK
ncbi:MBL fold metallo-hydrolase [Exiguobacterium aurantiacum]|uniref:MBL fold metallo-hydrolase n=1 Tax=Exiguobacterium aurantiacum TaxID=33987 RepID=UPI000877A750|nr:MBL fold metallo-hydrolase [Exiguobacterium aurantiacum]